MLFFTANDGVHDTGRRYIARGLTALRTKPEAIEGNARRKKNNSNDNALAALPPAYIRQGIGTYVKQMSGHRTKIAMNGDVIAIEIQRD